MSDAATLLGRLDAAERRLRAHAGADPPNGLTDPDPGGTERWEAGQVWAHLAEFPAYWLGQIRMILAAPGSGAVPFGRTKADAGRIGAIERDRREPPASLMTRVGRGLTEVRATLAELPPGAWRARGRHPTLGEMPLPAIVERFIVGHLEEHAEQLDRLAEAGGLVTLERIRDAARRIEGVALRTPLLAWDERTWLKPESLQPIGAFKIRGAYAKLASLTDAERRRGVVTFSSGNHAQAVARAARLLGTRAVIVMPSDAPAVKVAGVERDGAEIVRCGPGSEERRTIAERLVEDEGHVMIPPYDDPEVIAGQGTCGLEIVEQLPEVTSVLVPVSGGGLSAGIATAVKALRPSTRVVGVEPELAADARESLERGELVSWPAERTTRTIADGLRTQSLGRLNFAHLRRHLDGIVTVSDDEIAAAMRDLASRARLVVEPSGAAAMAAHLSGRAGSDERRVVVVSGGNVDPGRFAAILAGA